MNMRPGLPDCGRERGLGVHRRLYAQVLDCQCPFGLRSSTE
jgi:hypothetical protein